MPMSRMTFLREWLPGSAAFAATIANGASVFAADRDTLVVSQGWQGYGGPCPSSTPGVRLICFDPDPGNTRGEAQFVGRLAQRYHWHSVVLVTAREQDTRARIRMGRCFSGSIYVVAASLPLSNVPYQVAYEWGALFKALVLQRSC